MPGPFRSFREFYPYYLSEHQNPVCRRLHFVGTSLILLLILFVFLTQRWSYLFAIPVLGYGCAWIGHFFFEKNRPATFHYPLYSLMGDWVMFWQMLWKRIRSN